MSSRRNFIPLSLCLLGLTGPLPAQVQSPTPESATKLDTLKVVTAPVPGEVKAMGGYLQPEWTARRRFVTTRVFVPARGPGRG